MAFSPLVARSDALWIICQGLREGESYICTLPASHPASYPVKSHEVLNFCRLSELIPKEDRAFWVENVGCFAARAACWCVGFFKINWVEVRPNGAEDHIFTGVHSKDHPNVGQCPLLLPVDHNVHKHSSPARGSFVRSAISSVLVKSLPTPSRTFGRQKSGAYTLTFQL